MVYAPEVSVEKLTAQMFKSRKITRENQQQLMFALLSKDGLDDRDRQLMDRIFDGVREGLLQVVD